MLCPKCGKTIENDAAFCEHCGETIEDNVETTEEKKLSEIIKVDERLTVTDHKKKKCIGMIFGGVMVVVAFTLLIILGIKWSNDNKNTRKAIEYYRNGDYEMAVKTLPANAKDDSEEVKRIRIYAKATDNLKKGVSTLEQIDKYEPDYKQLHEGFNLVFEALKISDSYANYQNGEANEFDDLTIECFDFFKNNFGLEYTTMLTKITSEEDVFYDCDFEVFDHWGNLYIGESSEEDLSKKYYYMGKAMISLYESADEQIKTDEDRRADQLLQLSFYYFCKSIREEWVSNSKNKDEIDIGDENIKYICDIIYDCLGVDGWKAIYVAKYISGRVDFDMYSWSSSEIWYDDPIDPVSGYKQRKMMK